MFYALYPEISPEDTSFTILIEYTFVCLFFFNWLVDLVYLEKDRCMSEYVHISFGRICA